MPSYRRKDDFVCFVCDYWGGILAVFLIVCALLVYKVWYPWLIGQNGGTQVTPGPVVVASIEAEGTPGPASSTPTAYHTGTPETTGTPTGDEEIGDWLTFTDSRLGYTVSYPSTWFATPQDESTAEMQDGVLFSDAPGSTNPQTRSANENARVWIASYQRGKTEQTQWIIQHFNWISGELTPATMDGLPAQVATFAQADQPTWMNQITWIDRGETTLLVWAQYKKIDPDAQSLASHILETLQFVGQ